MRFRSTATTLPLTVILLTACANQTTKHESADARFERFSTDFIRTHYDHRPLPAVSLGWHQYDGQFQIRDAKNVAEEIARLRKYDNIFNAFKPASLSAEHQFELNLSKSTVMYERWFHESQRAFQHNPMTYVDQLDVSPYLIRDFKALDQRFADITAILKKAPAHFEAARQNLDATLPRAFVETAIDSANG